MQSNTLNFEPNDPNAKYFRDLQLELTAEGNLEGHSIAITIERQSYQRYYDSGFLIPRTLARLKLTINLREADIKEGKILPRQPDL